MEVGSCPRRCVYEQAEAEEARRETWHCLRKTGENHRNQEEREFQELCPQTRGGYRVPTKRMKGVCGFNNYKIAGSFQKTVGRLYVCP